MGLLGKTAEAITHESGNQMKTESKDAKLSFFEQIRQGLEESISHARGEVVLRSTKLPADSQRVQNPTTKEPTKPQ
jgi:hypothetical protein